MIQAHSFSSVHFKLMINSHSITTLSFFSLLKLKDKEIQLVMLGRTENVSVLSLKHSCFNQNQVSLTHTKVISVQICNIIKKYMKQEHLKHKKIDFSHRSHYF